MQPAPPVAITTEAPLVFPMDAKPTIGSILSSVVLGLFAAMSLFVGFIKIKAGGAWNLDSLGLVFFFPLLFCLTFFVRYSRKGARLEIASGQLTKYARDGAIKKTGLVSEIIQLQAVSTLFSFRPIGYNVRFSDGVFLSFPRDIANLKGLIEVLELQTGRKFVG